MRCAEVRRRHRLDDVKLVLITNASLFHRPQVRRALETLDANGGEIWAKLDAGTEDYYAQVNRSAVPWRQILDNLREAAARAADRHPDAIPADSRRTAAAGRTRGILRPAEGNPRFGRTHQAGSGPHHRPQAGRGVGRRAGRRRSGRHRRNSPPADGTAGGGVLRRRGVRRAERGEH